MSSVGKNKQRENSEQLSLQSTERSTENGKIAITGRQGLKFKSFANKTDAEQFVKIHRRRLDKKLSKDMTEEYGQEEIENWPTIQHCTVNYNFRGGDEAHDKIIACD